MNNPALVWLHMNFSSYLGLTTLCYSLILQFSLGFFCDQQHTSERRKTRIHLNWRASVFFRRGYTWIAVKFEGLIEVIVRIKMHWKHYQTVAHPKWEPQVGGGLFGIPLLIPHFKFQFSKSIKSSTFHIFLTLTHPLRKKISFPECPKIYTKPPNSGYGYKHSDLALLETWPRYCQKGCVKRRQNSLHLYPRLKTTGYICISYVNFFRPRARSTDNRFDVFLSTLSSGERTFGPIQIIYGEPAFGRNQNECLAFISCLLLARWDFITGILF